MEKITKITANQFDKLNHLKMRLESLNRNKATVQSSKNCTFVVKMYQESSHYGNGLGVGLVLSKEEILTKLDINIEMVKQEMEELGFEITT